MIKSAVRALLIILEFSGCFWKIKALLCCHDLFSKQKQSPWKRKGMDIVEWKFDVLMQFLSHKSMFYKMHKSCSLHNYHSLCWRLFNVYMMMLRSPSIYYRLTLCDASLSSAWVVALCCFLSQPRVGVLWYPIPFLIQVSTVSLNEVASIYLPPLQTSQQQLKTNKKKGMWDSGTIVSKLTIQ